MLNEFSLLAVGTVLSVPRGPITHYGVVIGAMSAFQPIIVASSKKYGRVIAQSLEEFSDGSPVTVVGYPGNLSPEVVAIRAQSKLGKTYDVFSNNCEQLVNDAHGLGSKSTQLDKWTLGAALAGLVVLIFFVTRPQSA